MGKADWSLDHLEQDLAAGFAFLNKTERAGATGLGESGAPSEGALQGMNIAIQKVSEGLAAQNRLRREFALARDEFRAAQAAQAQRVQELEAEVCALRRALAEERGRVQRAILRLSPAESPQIPPEDHLNRPLVLRSQQGDFLGVTDGAGMPLSLSGFLRLVEGGGCGSALQKRIVASCWEACAGGWGLTVTITMKQTRKCYILGTRALRTPNGNKVTLLEDMSLDGAPVPREFVVQMFRQLRDTFQEE